MSRIVEIQNPFEPLKDAIGHDVPAGRTFRDWCDKKLGEGVEFEYPTIAILNGKALMRDQWSKYKLTERDIIAVVPVQGWEVVGYIIYYAVLAYTLYTVITLDTPDFEAPEDGDPVWYASGQRNQQKLGSVIQCPYGKNLLFPAYAAAPYGKFENNDHYIYQLFCLGQGSYTIHDQFIDDTLIANFDDITTEVYAPGDSVTLFPDNVITSSEVASTVLFGPNEPDYAAEIGPFAANPAGTVTTILEWDVVFPRGLFKQESDGSLTTLQVDIDFRYRLIDDAGSPLGSFVTVAFTKTIADTTPQRFTVTTAVSSGRYEVDAVRTNNAALTTSEIDDVQWFQLRAQLPSTKDYGDVTLVAMKARASNNLNNQSRSKYNTLATRKLPIWNGSSFDAAADTRNPVWAFVDVLRNVYGANLSENAKIDLSGLLTLATAYDSRSDTFDWVFDRKTTIWDALKLIARAGRAAPVINLTEFSMVRDEIRTTPVMAFSPESMVQGSFKWDIRLQHPDDYDGIEIEYTDDTTFKLETVKCLVGSDLGTKLETIRLPGITDRDKAYREGLFIRAQQVYQREVILFKTGLEGNIPSFGDYIVVAHDVPEWGNFGIVESISGGVTVTLSESTQGIPMNRIAFRDKYGSVEGPYTCTKVSGNDYQVTTTTTIDETNIVFNDTQDPPAYYAGVGNQIYKEAIVTSITSDDEDTMTLAAINYDLRTYGFDARTANTVEVDAIGTVPEGIPDLPGIVGFTIRQDIDDPTVARLSWAIALGANYYLIQNSNDNTNWSDVTTTNQTSFVTSVFPGTTYFRVAGINDDILGGKGAWSTASATVGFDAWVNESNEAIVDDAGDRILFVTT